MVGARLTHGYHRDREPRPAADPGGLATYVAVMAVFLEVSRWRASETTYGTSTTSTTLSSWILGPPGRAAGGIAIITYPDQSTFVFSIRGHISFNANDLSPGTRCRGFCSGLATAEERVAPAAGCACGKWPGPARGGAVLLKKQVLRQRL